MTRAETRALISDTIKLWGTDATLAWAGDALTVATADGRGASIRRAPPLRWLLDIPGRSARPCASVVALLAALRAAVGPQDAVPPMRVTPSDGPGADA